MVAEVGAAWKRKAHLLALYSRVCPKRCDMTSQIAIRTHTHCINDHVVICARMCSFSNAPRTSPTHAPSNMGPSGIS